MAIYCIGDVQGCDGALGRLLDTIGFSASFELLKKGGVGVALFLGAAMGLVLIQNTLGAALASMLGVNPLIGLAAGSIALTGARTAAPANSTA